MENQAFWDQFKHMFEDPFQRRQLVEYFDKLVEDCTKNPKPMRVAFIGRYEDFVKMGDVKYLAKQGIEEIKEVSNGALTIVHCMNDDDVYGEKFDAFYVHENQYMRVEFYNAAFYLAGFNVPKLTKEDYLKLFFEHKNALQHA